MTLKVWLSVQIAIFLLFVSFTVGNDGEKSDDFAEFDHDVDDTDTEIEVPDSAFVEIDGEETIDKKDMHETVEPEDTVEVGDASEQEDFDPFSDEEEFEGYARDKTTKSKGGASPDLKITKVPVHLRTGWQSFYLEMLTIVGLLVYAANFFTGKSKNSKLATSWFKSHKTLLESNFSIVGDDGMSKEPQTGVLVKESESVYTLWCTGRQSCEGLLVELKLLKRHDLVSVIAQLMRPSNDYVHITVYMDDEDMDNFVFAVLPTKTAGKLQKDLQDLNYFCTEKRSGDKYGLPNTYSVVAEAGEVAQYILSTQVCKAIASYGDCFESMHFSDQYVGMKKDESEEEPSTKLKKPKKVLMFTFKVPGKTWTRSEHMASTEPLLRMVLFCIDRMRQFKLGKEAKAKSDKKRREVEESFLKLSHTQRQEAAMNRREEKRRAEKEKMMSEEDPDRQRRMEEREYKKDMKKKAPKMKQMKV